MKSAHQRIQEISKVMTRAVEKAAEKHRLMGVPMVVWKDGKVVEFLPKPTRATSSAGRKIQNLKTMLPSSAISPPPSAATLPKADPHP